MLPEISREIVCALLWSKDQKLLLGRKDPSKGGVFNDRWHAPGGGIEAGETQIQAVVREVREETGIDISNCELKLIDELGRASGVKTLASGEKALCHMHFYVYEVGLAHFADAIKTKAGDDLVELRWMDRAQLKDANLVDAGKELFQRLGYFSI